MANKVTMNICGQEYTLVADESAAYMEKVGALVDERMRQVLDALHVSQTDAAVLAAVNLADELLKEEHEHHHHAHDDECGCGHDHDHEHHHHDHDECGCGHDHDHEHHHHDHDDECGCGHHHDHHHHHADEVFTSWGRETIKKFTREGLEKMLENLSASEEYGVILRAKGMLPAEDGTWIYFDMVPEETEIREGSPEYTGRLCVIGSKLNEEKLVKLFGVA